MQSSEVEPVIFVARTPLTFRVLLIEYILFVAFHQSIGTRAAF
jgi:hypothetical protein